MDMKNIIRRMKHAKKLKYDVQLAKEIGLDKRYLSDTQKKGALPLSMVKWAIKEKLDLNWIFYGEND